VFLVIKRTHCVEVHIIAQEKNWEQN